MNPANSFKNNLVKTRDSTYKFRITSKHQIKWKLQPILRCGRERSITRIRRFAGEND
jgi:hypothetical protein